MNFESQRIEKQTVKNSIKQKEEFEKANAEAAEALKLMSWNYEDQIDGLKF